MSMFQIPPSGAWRDSDRGLVSPESRESRDTVDRHRLRVEVADDSRGQSTAETPCANGGRRPKCPRLHEASLGLLPDRAPAPMVVLALPEDNSAGAAPKGGAMLRPLELDAVPSSAPLAVGGRAEGAALDACTVVASALVPVRRGSGRI